MLVVCCYFVLDLYYITLCTLWYTINKDILNLESTTAPVSPIYTAMDSDERYYKDSLDTVSIAPADLIHTIGAGRVPSHLQNRPGLTTVSGLHNLCFYQCLALLYSCNTSIWSPYKKESLRLAIIHSVMDTSENNCIGSSALYTCRKCVYYHKSQRWQLQGLRKRPVPDSVEVPDAMVTNTGDTSPSGPVSLVPYEVMSDSEDDLSTSKKSSCMTIDTKAGSETTAPGSLAHTAVEYTDIPGLDADTTAPIYTAMESDEQ